jgi:O-antigen/teichoic acid export membrane protein
MIIGTATGTFIGFYYLKTTFQLRFDLTKLKTMLAFSIPIVPSSIAVFVNMYIDRLMINHYLSLKEVGLYGMGYRLASISTLVFVGFQMALTPLVYKHYQEPETPHQLATIFRTFLSIAIVVFLILSLFADVSLWILTTPAYYAAAQVVVFLVPAILLSQMYIFAPGIGDIVDKVRSFKTDSGLTNFCYNLFAYFNKRCFRTGKWAGFSPLMRARFQYG